MLWSDVILCYFQLVPFIHRLFFAYLTPGSRSISHHLLADYLNISCSKKKTNPSEPKMSQMVLLPVTFDPAVWLCHYTPSDLWVDGYPKTRLTENLSEFRKHKWAWCLRSLTYWNCWLSKSPISSKKPQNNKLWKSSSRWNIFIFWDHDFGPTTRTVVMRIAEIINRHRGSNWLVPGNAWKYCFLKSLAVPGTKNMCGCQVYSLQLNKVAGTCTSSPFKVASCFSNLGTAAFNEGNLMASQWFDLLKLGC